jgi:hypothetical protein
MPQVSAGFPGQALAASSPRQIDLFAQAIDVQEPEDVPPSLLRLRRHRCRRRASWQRDRCPGQNSLHIARNPKPSRWSIRA